MNTWLGIDWGVKKIGLALGHQETGVAVAWGVLPNDPGLMEALTELIRSEGVDALVVGVPQRVQHPEEHPARRFGNSLREALGVPVSFTDEMFTSRLAQQALKQRGETAVMAQDDAEAARILLQDWLDTQSKN